MKNNNDNSKTETAIYIHIAYIYICIWARRFIHYRPISKVRCGSPPAKTQEGPRISPCRLYVCLHVLDKSPYSYDIILVCYSVVFNRCINIKYCSTCALKCVCTYTCVDTYVYILYIYAIHICGWPPMMYLFGDDDPTCW